MSTQDNQTPAAKTTPPAKPAAPKTAARSTARTKAAKAVAEQPVVFPSRRVWPD